MCGHRASDDATLQVLDETNYHGKLRGVEKLDSKPFSGRRFAIIKETMGESPISCVSSLFLYTFVLYDACLTFYQQNDDTGSGVDKSVAECITEASKQMEELGVRFLIRLRF